MTEVHANDRPMPLFMQVFSLLMAALFALSALAQVVANALPNAEPIGSWLEAIEHAALAVVIGGYHLWQRFERSNILLVTYVAAMVITTIGGTHIIYEWLT